MSLNWGTNRHSATWHPAPHHPRDSISELWTGNVWTLVGRGTLGSHYGLFSLWWDTMHRKHRQGDANIGESNHNLDGHLPKWPLRALDPRGLQLGHFCETLQKQYSNWEPKGPGALQPLSLTGMTLAGIALLGSLFNSVTTPFIIIIHILYKLVFLFLLL